MFPPDIQHCGSQCVLYEVYGFLHDDLKISHLSVPSTRQHQERFPEFCYQLFYERREVKHIHTTSPQRMFITKECIQTEEEPVLKNDPTIRIHTQLTGISHA